MYDINILKALFHWRAFLDILLIAVGLFFLYRTLLRSGTWKIVTGILIAMAFFLGANLLDLKGLEWIYSNVSSVVLIALIVIFQPELRKIFERAASLRRKEIIEPESGLPGLISEAVFALAAQKRGAIVVLPGKEPHREWVSGGYALNAEPSFPLIMSIFDPNSPGHDGAVIIRNGLLTRFGARLPVSRSNSLAAEYGTRHHAAMGLAEVSDALVVVVSEERGSVMLFHHGKAERVHRKEAVADRILSHWQDTASYPFKMFKWRRQRELIVQMVVSLVIAVVFWTGLIVSRGGILGRMFTVPVEYSGIPANLALIGDRSQEVKLHLAGSKTDLGVLNPDLIGVKIDLTNALPGKQTFAVTPESIRLPRGVHLMDAEPSTLTLTLASIVERDVAVRPQLVGRLPKGFKLKSIDVRPQKLRVLLPFEQGQENEIGITTTPIYLETIREDTTIMCKIIAPASIQPAGKRWPDVEVSLLVIAPP